MSMTEVTEIKPYSTKELSHIYGVSDKTLRKWIVPFQEEIGKKQGHYYNVAQVEIIFRKLGLPYRIS